MVLVVLLVLVVLFALSGVLGHYDSRISKHGPHALLARWLFAHKNWAGNPVTNRGFTRPGTKALTPTGHAHRRWYLPALAAFPVAYPEYPCDSPDLRWAAVPVPPHRRVRRCHSRRRGRSRGVAGAVMGGGLLPPQELRQAAARPSRRRRGNPAGQQAGVVAGDPPRPVVREADLAEGRPAAETAGTAGDRVHRRVHARHEGREVVRGSSPART